MLDPLSKKILTAVDAAQREIFDFLKKLVQTPSISGREKEIATLIQGHMLEFGFKDTQIDSVGNVIGSLGEGRRALLFDSHLDHVPPGPMSEPFSAKILDGKRFGVRGEVMYGRGTCDTKGSVCCMLMACKALIDQGIRLNGNLTFAGVVMEESGGSLGTNKLLEDHTFDCAVIGEPSDLNIAFGQRGGAFLYLDVKGLSGHVARSEHCVNAFEKSIQLVDEVRKEVRLKLRKDRKLGKPALSFTNVHVDPGFVSIIPDRALINFDLRYTLNYSPEQLIADIRRCVKRMQASDPQLDVTVGYMTNKLGSTEYREDIPPFYTDPDGIEVRLARKTIGDVIGHIPQSIVWPFATDGGFVSRRGIPTIGFGPGDYRFVHAINEHIQLQSLITATKIYALLAMRILGHE